MIYPIPLVCFHGNRRSWSKHDFQIVTKQPGLILENGINNYLLLMTIKTNILDRFSTILPTTNQTYFLRACLWTGESARKAWSEWHENVSDPIKTIRQDNCGIKRLLPMLHDALKRNNIVADKTLLTCLRSAYFREELRSKIYWNICKSVLSAFDAASIKSIMLKGAALIGTIYTDPSLRHCHDIDILLDEDDAFHTTNILPTLGFEPLDNIVNNKWNDIKFRHKSGLPLELHRNLFQKTAQNIEFAELWERSQLQEISGQKIRILSPLDNLIQICVNAFYDKSRLSSCWACDAWLLINCYPDLAWNSLLESVKRYNIELPIAVTFEYLTKELKASIPSTILNGLYSFLSEKQCEVESIGKHR